MPSVVRNPRCKLFSNPTTPRISAGAHGTHPGDLENLIRIQPMNAVSNKAEPVTQIPLRFTPNKPTCPAPTCSHDFWWAPLPRKSRRAQQELEQEQKKPYINVMYDRRIVRGTNFPPSLMEDIDPFNRYAELQRQKALKKIHEKHNCKSRNKRNVIGTVPPVPGRAHLEVQTDKYLEELAVRPPTYSAEAQTDLFLERPYIPPYRPAKTGKDASTEIADGELFHFDAEAQPIIDVLVDAAIEYSILEVAQEQEIGAIRAKKERFMVKREAELSDLRRLEAEEMRLQAEKERRLRQDQIAKDLDAEMQRAVVAAKFIQGHVSSLLPEILENLEPASDHVKKQHLLQTMCPWLCEEAKKETKHIVQSRNILNSMIADIARERACVYGGYCEPIEPLVGIAEEEEDAGAILDAEACSCDSSRSICASSTDELGPNDKKC